MDVYGLKKYIIENPDYIYDILEQSGFYYIDERDKEYRCARKLGRNPTSVKVNIETLSATCFSTNLKGDLLTLVQSKLNLSFPKTIKYIAEIVGYKDETPYEKFEPPFGGFYKNIAKLRNDNMSELETYSDNILNQFQHTPNQLFFEDGILPGVQMKYQIGYDSVSSRITLPWYTFSGEICGVMGRLNRREVDADEAKWFPIIPFPKSKTLYGYVTNYNSIQERSIAFLGESEKHSLQLASKGFDVGLSLGGSFMSETQANHVKSLFPKKIIVMMDEGLNEEHSREIAEQLKMDNFYKNEVGYVFDKNNLILPKDSKMAPADLDRVSLNDLIKKCTIWV